MEIFEKLKERIEKSPLEFIKGDCRFLHLEPNEWLDWKDEDFPDVYSENDRTISLSVGEEFLGNIIVEKENIEAVKFEDNGDFLMTVDIRRDGLIMFIFLFCKNGFPGLLQYGQFVADIVKRSE